MKGSTENLAGRIGEFVEKTDNEAEPERLRKKQMIEQNCGGRRFRTLFKTEKSFGSLV